MPKVEESGKENEVKPHDGSFCNGDWCRDNFCYCDNRSRELSEEAKKDLISVGFAAALGLHFLTNKIQERLDKEAELKEKANQKTD